ncbi:MAG: peptidase U62 [Myxococcales bacterium]|nr:peptidase U62 [Myxococcales bacterium]
MTLRSLWWVALSLTAVLPLGASRHARAGSPGEPDILATMTAALAEASTQLGLLKDVDRAYSIAYSVNDHRALTILSSHGAFAGMVPEHYRSVDVDVRVGSLALDSTHKIRDESYFSGTSGPQWLVGFEGGADPLRRLLLRATDDAYRAALARLLKVRSNEAVKVQREDDSADYSMAPVQKRIDVPGDLVIDRGAWQELTRAASGIYLAYPEVYDSAVQLVVTEDDRWIVNNEGTAIRDGRRHLRVATWAETVAEDGMALSVYDYVEVASAANLPDRARIDAMVRQVAERTVALRNAPVIEPWSGPAILRGRAAGVFFHEIFGHRIEGHRQKDEDEGQTFTHRVGQAILPTFLSVVDDPTLERLANEDLNGHYAIDDEGVAAERVSLVERGVLRNFLMSRAPIEGFPKSNGHGRRQSGNFIVPRQGNLMVQAEGVVAYAELRKRLIAELGKQKKPWGLVFDDISGGFTFTGRSTPNSFVVQPVTVWRVFFDGRPDELVRGVDLIGTPLTTFGRILAAGGEVEVFNGMCGAESGWVPVSASSPSLLVQEVEVQRREKGNDRPPLSSPPVGTN